MTVTNPWDPTGTNAFGRWFYGPWFNPPTPVCGAGGARSGMHRDRPRAERILSANLRRFSRIRCCTAPWEPPFRPGVPNPSIPGESFMDTPDRERNGLPGPEGGPNRRPGSAS